MRQQNINRDKVTKDAEPARKSRESYIARFPATGEGKKPCSETINKPIEVVAAALQKLTDFPKFLENLEKVSDESGENSEWNFKTGTQPALKVPMKFTSKSKNEFSYESTDAAGFKYQIKTTLVPAQAGRGTIVQMAVSFESSTAKFASLLESLFGADAELLTKKTAQRFKAFCETGHVPTIEGQPNGNDETTTNSLKH